MNFFRCDAVNPNRLAMAKASKRKQLAKQPPPAAAPATAPEPASDAPLVSGAAAYALGVGLDIIAEGFMAASTWKFMVGLLQKDAPTFALAVVFRLITMGCRNTSARLSLPGIVSEMTSGLALGFRVLAAGLLLYAYSGV